MGELESIKDLLDKDTGPKIPTLDDSIADSADSKAPQLNLDSIFDDLANTAPPTLADTLSATTAPETLIPILDDQTSTKEPQPLDAIKTTTTAAQSSSMQKPERQQQSDFSIDLLIQEIVDEYIPHIEAQLRERLSQCEPDIIRQLANKKVSP
jgi:hypothetical protein